MEDSEYRLGRWKWNDRAAKSIVANAAPVNYYEEYIGKSGIWEGVYNELMANSAFAGLVDIINSHAKDFNFTPLADDPSASALQVLKLMSTG